MNKDKFRILSLGPGLGHLELYTCKLLQAAKKGEVCVWTVYAEFDKELRKTLGDKEYEESKSRLDTELHLKVMEKYSKSILEEYDRKEFEMMGIEGWRVNVKDLNKLSKEMCCPINVIEYDFTNYDFESSKYDMILGGHVFYLYIYRPFMRECSEFMGKMFELAPVMVFLEYKHEIESKEKAIEKAVDYGSKGKFKVTFDPVKNYNSCVVKIKRT